MIIGHDLMSQLRIILDFDGQNQSKNDKDDSTTKSTEKLNDKK